MLSRMQISKSTFYLCIPLFILQAAYGFGLAQDGQSFDLLSAWHVLALYWVLGWWFLNDTRFGMDEKNNYMDMGMFLYLAGFIILPLYLFKSRGWKAFYSLGLILISYLGGLLAGIILHVLLSVF